MTLTDILPSLRASLPPRLDPEIWPLTTHRCGGGDIEIGGIPLNDLAEQHGTPTYLLDEADVRARCCLYGAAFGAGNVVYAAKALTCRGLLRWIGEEGMGLEVYSAGQLAVAASVGFPAGRIVLHGDAKTPRDLRAALSYGVGRIVIESPCEVARLAALSGGRRQRVLLRVLPTHLDFPDAAGLSAAADADRFGVTSDELDETVARIAAQPCLELAGLDICLGSQVSRFGGYERALSQLVALTAELRERHDVPLEELNIGGGHAVAYTHGEPEFAVDAFADRIHKVLTLVCERHKIPQPRLLVTPGRAIVARAGVALYRVLAVRRDADGHQLAAVDGGLSDNPRPALYGARYTAALVGRIGAATIPTTVIGRHDEAGDILVRDASLPADLRPGDLLAVPGCGAYHLPLASNYNLVTRPPLVAVHTGQSRLLLRAETVDDLLARDLDT